MTSTPIDNIPPASGSDTVQNETAGLMAFANGRRGCPRCGHPDLHRVQRRWWDHWRGPGVRVRRFRCGRCSHETTQRSREE